MSGTEGVGAGRVVWLLAGEASGDILGARLMEALRRADPALAFVGVGGARMEALGLRSLFPMQDLAVMGLVEVLPRLQLLSRRLDEVVQDIERRRPDMIVTVDSPGFSLRLLRRTGAMGIRRVHFVAPQVWAWHQERVKDFPGLWDRLLCLLPFEVEWYARHGLDATFVGHPVLQSGADRGDAARFRMRHGLAPDAPVVVLMPGSRRSEVPRLLPIFGAMLQVLKARIPDIHPVIPISSLVAARVRKGVARWPVPPHIVTDLNDKHDAFAAAGAALTKSGTSTLELALAGVPMAVTYRVNPLTAFFARRMIKVPYVAMVNLLAGREVVPELLQQDCAPEKLADAVQGLLFDPSAAARQRAAFREVIDSLRPPPGFPTAADAAAADILEVMSRPVG
ncbi:lipid-A-disaccharide synthase [Acidomonas methanolica]|uniref:Lipid-A-disaccharide synthase n=2 Tax=Acidomonas methanolica TaxID=437 RepID=A0A023D1T1_ACIMT|nr:lipid-A-disaccharide synthase [Acidomonas methanolica]MBU2654602.1 lipid-A-disaccharide synthase [Acidomonas methanolica]TCS27475.1 lipid-A-disaccharide synthase [Acidomonas methanolica]GAJ28044.1 lipid-A-disaccharide synthase [Acidomonas methanolica NBRC 104435]GEK98618.1 lipid-A-disaccharide synthase [Acidomonas methanolica NBRC 104435]